jgi:hypothetical protein
MTTWLILFLLFVKHFLADFVWQSDSMVLGKGQYGQLGGLQHSALHGALTYVILMHFLDLQACVMLAIIDAVVHYHVDWAKMNITKNYTADDKQFWFWVGFDQLLHSVTYLAIGFVAAILMSEYI